MYFIMARDQSVVQNPPISILVDENQENAVKSNPYVIRNGSNAMPKGMGQNDNTDFMPQWQKDKLKDMKGEPYVGSATDANSSKDPAPPPPKENKPKSNPQSDMTNLLDSIPDD